MWPLWVAIIFFISMRYVCPKFLSIIHYKSYEETYEVRTVDSLKEINASDTNKELEISKYAKLIDYFWFYVAVIFYLAILIVFILQIKYAFENHLLYRILLTAPPFFVSLLWGAYLQLTTMWMDIPSYQVMFEPNKLIVIRQSKSDVISYSDIETINVKVFNNSVVSIRLILSQKEASFKKCIRISGFNNKKNLMKIFIENYCERVKIW